jgi:hypothetical protein
MSIATFRDPIWLDPKLPHPYALFPASHAHCGLVGDLRLTAVMECCSEQG